MIRATLRSLLARKLRLILSGLAVVLGTMSVSGALIVTDTLERSFDSLFSTVSSTIDVEVSAPQQVAVDESDGEPVTPPIPADVVDTIAAVPGVESAIGVVFVDGARPLGDDGKVVGGGGPPQFGVSWNPGDELVELREGRGPGQAGEVAVNAGLADVGDYQLGDRVDVLTPHGRGSYQLVGIFGYVGDRDTFGGETRIAFSLDVAQETMLGAPGTVSNIDVTAAPGVSDDELRDRVSAALGGDYLVRTGAEFADEQAAGVGEFLSVLRTVLLGFAGVALFVGVFLILNTFAIIVAQRTSELALLRALGAGRGQVVRSVLAEAVVIGLVASTLGLGADTGVAMLLRMLMEAFSGANLPGAAVSVPLSAVIAAYAVGVAVTVIAALVPALRAAKIAPVAAMRVAASADRPLTRLTAVGVGVTAVGAGAVGAALFGGAGILTLVAGVLLSFIGVAMLTPAISRPAVTALGRLLSWSTPGALGRRNSARNPRRTAITAATLMVGVALVTGVSVLADSFKTSIERLVTQDVQADLVIGGETTGRAQPTFDPTVVAQARQLPGVESAVAIYADQVQIGSEVARSAGADLLGVASVFGLSATAGDLRPLEPGEIALADSYAADVGADVGGSVTMATQRGGTSTYRIVATFADSDALGASVITSVRDAESGFRSSRPTRAYVQLAPDVDADVLEGELAALLAGEPEVGVLDQTAYADQQASQVDSFVVLLYILLGLAVVIGMLGIINTLALSVVERTRELGLVRAVGMRRRQVVSMITVESVVIALFGALLGMVVGTVLGAAVARALRDEGVSAISMPWSSLALFAVLGVVIGLLAAILPGVRASRVDVLRAIAYE